MENEESKGYYCVSYRYLSINIFFRTKNRFKAKRKAEEAIEKILERAQESFLLRLYMWFPKRENFQIWKMHIHNGKVID